MISLAYLSHLFIIIGIYILLAASLNLALGYTGLLNLGHIAFFGVGAYTSALLVLAGVPFLIAFFASGLIAAFFGFVLVSATRKLKGDYMALATLGFAFVMHSLFMNMAWLTRGPLGIAGIPKPSIFGIVLASNLSYLFFVTVIVLFSLFFLKKLVDSPFGRLLAATRDNESRLRSLGKDTFQLKWKAMMISAFFAGIAGSLFAHYISYIDPSSFILSEIILVLTLVIVGGIASLSGSVVAAALLIFIPEFLRFAPISGSLVGPLRQILYAVILLAILLWKPRGLFGKVDLQ